MTGLTDSDDAAPWQPCREPIGRTLLRNLIIALVVSTVLAWRWGSLARWPLAFVLVLWPALGGHWVEVWFLNYVRPRLPIARGVQIGVRVLMWFIAGVALAFAMKLTALAVGYRPAHWPAWWLGGLAFIPIELAAHLLLVLRGCPNFYNGRG